MTGAVFGHAGWDAKAAARLFPDRLELVICMLPGQVWRIMKNQVPPGLADAAVQAAPAAIGGTRWQLFSDLRGCFTGSRLALFMQPRRGNRPISGGTLVLPVLLALRKSPAAERPCY